MRKLLSPCALAACALLASCGGNQTADTSTRQNSNASANSAKPSGASAGANAPGVASSHASGGRGASAGGSADKPTVATPEMDAKIEKAAAKAKAAGASQADKKAAADAYFERANFYRDEGLPALYKFALADYRRGLRLDPSNSDARAKMDEIVRIYEGMGRPVPELGNEP